MKSINNTNNEATLERRKIVQLIKSTKRNEIHILDFFIGSANDSFLEKVTRTGCLRKNCCKAIT